MDCPQDQNSQGASSLCVGGCGFYGSSATDNLCSVCWKQKRANQVRATNMVSASSSCSSPPSSSNVVVGQAPSNISSFSESSATSEGQPIRRTSSKRALQEPDGKMNDGGDNTQGDVTGSSPQKLHKSDHSASPSPAWESGSQPSSAAPPSHNAVLSAVLTSSLASPDSATPLPVPVDAETPIVDSVGVGGESSSLSVAPATVEAPPLLDHSRCHVCTKRLGLMPFKCRCGLSFCRPHQHAEAHQCTFDYRQLARTTLETRNPKVAASKLEKL